MAKRAQTRQGSGARLNPAAARAQGWRDPLAPQQPLVSARWLIKAVLIVFGLAFVCAYLSLCLLFYQGQWQIVFHPSRTITGTPANAGLKYEDIRFDYQETGVPQLAGWWVPADPSARYADRTVLLLHGNSGSLSDTVPAIKLLHQIGINVFAFDYRGFGQSANVHPSEQRVYADADAAWRYLIDTRHLAPGSIVVLGEALGSTIAAQTAMRHPEVAGMVLADPGPPALDEIRADARTSVIPVALLFRDRFAIEPLLQASTKPKLFLIHQGPSDSYASKLAGKASAPKFTAYLSGPGPYDPQLKEALRRFLDQLWP